VLRPDASWEPVVISAPQIREHFVPAVVLIDRDHDTGEILTLALGAQGFPVNRAEDAAAGLLLARTTGPAVVITEFVVDGRCLVEELRGMPETAGTPAVVLTTSVFPDTRRRVGAARGIFMPKPMEPRALVRTVMQLAALGGLRPAPGPLSAEDPRRSLRRAPDAP
jgi:DNA-binding response OmpR family regulator